MPIFPVRTGIGGDGNEKWCCLIPSYSSLLSNFKVQGSGFRVQGCGGGFAASIYGAMPESSIQSQQPPFQMGVYLEPLRGFVLTPAYGRSSKLSLYLQPPMAALSLIRLTYFSNLSLSSCSEM